VNIVHKADACHQCKSGQEPRIVKAEKRAPHPNPYKEDYTTASQHNRTVTASLVRLIYNIAPVGNTKVKQLRYK
jgi:hypothetical protein